MSWKKYFKSTSSTRSPLSHRAGKRNASPSVGQYPNLLKESYLGCNNRVQRYQELEIMGLDSTIATAMDIISQFSTQEDESTGLCFKINYKEEATETETTIIKDRLESWYYLNEFHKRIFRIFRNVLKYGDQVFLRDPETFKLHYVEMDNVIKVIVNESKGKKPEQYVIRNLNMNFQNLTATQVNSEDMFNMIPAGPGYSSNGDSFNSPNNPYSSSSRFALGKSETPIDASNILHLSLTEGLDANWPFGTSILESVFKVYKQKEMLEDSIVIYRIQRAPARRVFKIDVGEMPSYQAQAYVEKLKNELYQRRIPTMGPNGSKFVDTSYQSMAINEDFFLPISSSGKGTDITQLNEGMNLGEINDLRYFDNKLIRGLQIPSSYIPTGAEDGTQAVNDGKVGIALIQEYCFNRYCERLQRLICDLLDLEFKAYLKWCGVTIDTSIFKLTFNPPQNFAQYRQTEQDAARINIFSQMAGFPFMSKRFLMKRYLGLNEDEMNENAKLHREETMDLNALDNENGNLRDLGVTSGSIDSDMQNFPAMGNGEEGEMPEETMAGEEGASDETTGPSATGGGGPESAI
jgi:hypothetical protein